jgi:hypothetical protein
MDISAAEVAYNTIFGGEKRWNSNTILW